MAKRRIGYLILGCAAGLGMMGTNIEWVKSLGCIVAVFCVLGVWVSFYDVINDIDIEEGKA